MATSAPVTSGSQPSALLRCLSQLNADTWAQVLLPKLLEQGSAADVALSCSQLRDLCYSSRQGLNLGALLDSTEPWSLRAQVQNLPLHFPNCTSVLLQLKSDDCYHTFPCVLPALARLPKLDGLSLDWSCKLQTMWACTMLYCMREQLPGLRGLTLTVNQSGDWMAAEGVHRELGEMTQLMRLCLDYKSLRVDDPVQYPAVEHLSALQQLQDLTIRAKCKGDSYARCSLSVDDSWPAPPPQLLSALTNLTSLDMNVFDLGTLVTLSSCVSLQHLAVYKPDTFADSQLGSADWACLASLTGLTELWLMKVQMKQASPEACEALSKLTRLQVAAAFEWWQEFLPALTACVQLTEICGQWQWAADSDCTAPPLPQILSLNMSSGPKQECSARYESFPNLRYLREDVLVDGTQYEFDIVLSCLHQICALYCGTALVSGSLC